MALIRIEIRIWNCFPPDCTTNGNIFRMHLLLIPNRGSAQAIIANRSGRARQTITSISVHAPAASFALVSNYVTLRFNDRAISQWLAVRHAWPKGAWQLQCDIFPMRCSLTIAAEWGKHRPTSPATPTRLTPTQPISGLINAFAKMTAEIEVAEKKDANPINKKHKIASRWKRNIYLIKINRN